MRQLVIKDERGQLVAWLGAKDEFLAQRDSASLMAQSNIEPMAWIDWVESNQPGSGTSLMEEALSILDSEGVRLVGLEVYPKEPNSLARVIRFYEKFGFVDVSAVLRGVEFPIMFRESSWNGIET